MTRREAVKLAAARELDNAKRWSRESSTAGNRRAAKRFQMDAHQARMRAVRLLSHLNDRRAIPRELEALVQVHMRSDNLTTCSSGSGDSAPT